MGPRPLQDQDSREACHKGRSEDGLRSGDQSEGEGSEDRREGLPSCRAQGADLRGSLVQLHAVSVPETWLPWESHGSGLGVSALMRVILMRLLVVYMCLQ